MTTLPLPPQASDYLMQNFPDGFQFDDFHQENDRSGHILFNLWINDGSMLHEFIFSEEGKVQKHNVRPAYEDAYNTDYADSGDYYEDDF